MSEIENVIFLQKTTAGKKPGTSNMNALHKKPARDFVALYPTELQVRPESNHLRSQNRANARSYAMFAGGTCLTNSGMLACDRSSSETSTA